LAYYQRTVTPYITHICGDVICGHRRGSLLRICGQTRIQNFSINFNTFLPQNFGIRTSLTHTEWTKYSSTQDIIAVHQVIMVWPWLIETKQTAHWQTDTPQWKAGG